MSKIMGTPVKVGVRTYAMYASCRILSHQRKFTKGYFSMTTGDCKFLANILAFTFTFVFSFLKIKDDLIIAT